MADTPKIPKGRGRSSLSLKKRLHKKHSSPQHCVQDTPNAVEFSSSPRVCFNVEAKECTPPHKKLNLDDCLDDSPLSFDGSFSPTTFLSQTFGSESPDVVWRWTQDEFIDGEVNTKTDSGFSSKNFSSSVDPHKSYERIEMNRQAYYNKCDERRRAKETKIRKAEKARIEALLRERLATLESQFKSVRTSTQEPQKTEEVVPVVEKSPTRSEYLFDDIDNVFEESNIDFEDPKPTINVQNDLHANSLDDFFNDSDTDCLLVEATQQIESVIPELSQRITQTPKTESLKKNTNMNSTNKEKRSSLYMKFLEDDEDDFFVSLDDDWLQKATQSSKSRSPFQRYKSMPTTTTTTKSSSICLADEYATAPSADINNKKFCPNGNGIRNPTSTSHSIKRHASSHAMSPSNTKYRGRQLPSRN